MKISIITPCFNSRHTLRNTCISIYSQTYKNFEHLIIDGLSTDGTLETLDDLVLNKTSIYSEKDEGIYDAINKGILKSTGDVIGILNSDDIFYSDNSLKLIVDAFIADAKIDCVYGNLVYMDDKQRVRRVWKSGDFAVGRFEKSWSPAHPTFYCKKEIYNSIGLYDISYKIAGDVEFMLRVLEIHKRKSLFIDQFLVKMGVGGVSNSGFRSTLIITSEMVLAFKNNGLKLDLYKYFLFKAFKIRELIITKGFLKKDCL